MAKALEAARDAGYDVAAVLQRLANSGGGEEGDEEEELSNNEENDERPHGAVESSVVGGGGGGFETHERAAPLAVGAGTNYAITLQPNLQRRGDEGGEQQQHLFGMTWGMTLSMKG